MFRLSGKHLAQKLKTTGIVIDEFTLLGASWVIRARWREIQRFVRTFKTMKSFHDMQFWVFYLPKQKICPQRCGSINLERMAIVEIILSKRVLPYISKGTKLQRMYGDKKAIFRNSKERIPSLVLLSCEHEPICLVYEGESL